MAAETAGRLMMNTQVFLATIVGASLLAVAGCGQDRESSANRESQPAKEAPATTDTPAPRSMDRTTPSGTTAMEPSTEPSLLGEASEANVLGKQILSKDGKEVGRVANVVADHNGENRFAVVDVGGFLGVGEKQVAVDVRQLRLTADGRIESDLTEDVLKSMPEYDPADYQEQQHHEGTQ